MVEKILITGTTGFIGGVVYKYLKEKGYDVKPFVGDIRKESDIIRNLRDIDTVIHFAALTYLPPSWDTPHAYFETNTFGTLNFLKAHTMFKKFIYISTSHVYGWQTKFPIEIDQEPCPLDPYACSKLASEKLVDAYQKRYGFKALIVRPFNNFGPTQSRHFLIPSIIRQYLKNGKIVLKGTSEREFIYVNDTATILEQLLLKDATGLVQICQEKTYKLEDIAKIITPNVIVEPTDRGNWDIPKLWGSRRSLDKWVPNFAFTPIDVAIKETLKKIEENENIWKRLDANKNIWEAY